MSNNKPKNNQITENEHFVPQFYLKQWCCNDKKISALNKQYNTIRSYSPKECCCEKYLYEIFKDVKLNIYIDALRLNDMENKYGELETECGLLWKYILPILREPANQRVRIFNKKEKDLLDKFITTIILRNPYTNNKAIDSKISNDLLSDELDCLNQLDLTNDNQTFISNIVHIITRDYTYANNNSNELAGKAYRDLNKFIKTMHLYILQSDNPFFTADIPFYIHDNFIFIPISPDFACLYSSKKQPILKRNHIYKIQKEHTDAFNRILKGNCYNFIYSNNKDLLKLYQD